MRYNLALKENRAHSRSILFKTICYNGLIASLNKGQQKIDAKVYCPETFQIRGRRFARVSENVHLKGKCEPDPEIIPPTAFVPGIPAAPAMPFVSIFRQDIQTG